MPRRASLPAFLALVVALWTPQALGLRLPEFQGPLLFQDQAGEFSLSGELSGGMETKPQGLAVNLRIRHGRLKTPWISGPLLADARLIQDGSGFDISKLRILFPQCSLAGVSDALPALEIQAKGRISSLGDRVDLENFTLTLGQGESMVLDALGSIAYNRSSQTQITAKAKTTIHARELLDLMGHILPKALQDLRASGAPQLLISMSRQGKSTALEGGFQPRDLAMALPEGTLEPGLFPTEPLRFSGTLENASLLLPALGALDLEFTPDLRLHASGLALEGLLLWARALTGLPLDGWTAGGSMEAEFSGPPKAKTGKLSVQGMGLSSADGRFLADNIQADALLQLPSDSFEAQLSLPVGECLVDTVYLDFGDKPFTAQAKGSWKNKRLQLENVTVILGEIVRVIGGGWITPQPLSYDASLEIPETDLAPLARTFIQDPLALSQPGLAAMPIAGRLALNIQARGDGDGLGLTGRIYLKNAAAGELRDINLDLPLAYAFGRAVKGATPDWGVLSMALGLPWANATIAELPVRLSANRLSLPGPVELPLPGGTLELSSIEVEEPLSSVFSVQGVAGLRTLDLSGLPAGSINLEGRISGESAPFQMNLKELAYDGRLHGEFFGGSLELFGLGAVRPLAASRTLQAGVKSRDMDLERLSGALGIGRITGRLHLDLLNMETAYGQPTDFEFRAWTPEEDDSEHSISLKAVNAISVMGTGSGLSGFGISMFSSLFKEFSYDKIGLYCELTNDVFHIRGLISEGGIEYLIKKPPLFGINVINGNPDNRISFSDMLKRVQRVINTDSVQSNQEEKP